MIEAAAILSAVARHWEDFTIIAIMLLVNAGVGFWQEHKADNAIAALKTTLALKARVLRDGACRTIEARNLVPGDVILLRLGNIVPADAELAEGEFLSVDQSALTGESLPVDKAAGDPVYSGSVAKRGEMKAVVIATGENTYFGQTARLVESAGNISHFQRAVIRIGNFLIVSTIGLVAQILVVAFSRQDPLVDTILFALILTVAAIPVALPAVLSVTMAVGAVRLARMKAIVSRLVSIEEMAGMDVLCSDKTGTLTKNEIAVGEPMVTGARDADELLLCAALASRAEAGDDQIDAAIFAAFGDLSRLKGHEIIRFHPFDPVCKRTEAEAEVEFEGRRFRVAKGAPQVILDMAGLEGEERRAIEGRIRALAEKGFRTLGVARQEPGKGWRLLGVLSLFDPPRDDSVETIERAREMGLDIRMVTGDNAAIAREIARKLHLGTSIVPAREIFDAKGHVTDPARIREAEGFAEVFPEHKYEIVRTLHADGHIVGMTGDGVNDAPALKQADIGIAVSGATDAARAAADLILTEAGLSVITRAMEEARKIFERMNSYAIFRIAETIRILLFMTLSILAFNFYPVTAVMIVLLAILNDFPIMMIAYDNVTTDPPPVRWNMKRVLTLATVLGVLGVISSFGLFWIGEVVLQLPRETIQTLIFLKLLVAGHLTI
jgi:H+-transporting ATPase